jgi:serralysin
MCSICGNAFHIPTTAVSANAGPVPGPTSAAPSLDLAAIITQLRTSWGGQWENDTYPVYGTNIQYAILTSAPLDSSSENSGWQAMTDLMAARATEAFEVWDDLIAINMTRYVGNPPAGAEVIQFGYSSATSGGGTYQSPELGYNQGVNEFGGDAWAITRSEIWMNSSWSTHSTSSAINQAGYGYYGGYGFTTYMHEIGHALGLSHPGSYDASNGAVTYATGAEYLQDTQRYTVMSYFDADEDGSGTDHYGSNGQWRNAQTPMLHDIAAAHAIYGADPTTRTGNTTYGFNSNAGKDVYDFTKNTNPIITIYDAGGVDTLDLSGFGSGQYGGQVINLTAGSWSNVGGYMTNNLSIAYGTVIENAIGGSGNDTITGNAVANRLDGGGGNDTLNGGEGNDIAVYSGDRVVYTISSLAGGSVKIADSRGTLGDGSDVASNIEDFQFADRSYNLSELYTTLGSSSADFNGDGKADILLHNDNDSNFLWQMNGFEVVGGGWIPAAGSAWHIVSMTDFDGDNKADVLLQNDNGANYLWRMDGPQIIGGAWVPSAGDGWHVVGTADFNGDDKADILLQNDNGANYLWQMNGAQIIGGGWVPSAGNGWHFAELADFNGDNMADILLQNDNGANYLWQMNGAQIIGGGWVSSAGAGWHIAEAADFSGDGKADILLNNDNGSNFLWEMNGNQIVGGGWVPSAGVGWNIVDAADFSGDGKSDILLHNDNGSNFLWKMNGSQIVEGGWVPSPGDAWDIL